MGEPSAGGVELDLSVELGEKAGGGDDWGQGAEMVELDESDVSDSGVSVHGAWLELCCLGEAYRIGVGVMVLLN